MVKRKDFKATIKQLTDCLERMCSGNRFHSDGAATANERAPNFVAVLGMIRSSRAADLSLRLASVEDTGRHISARQCGARPCTLHSFISQQTQLKLHPLVDWKPVEMVADQMLYSVKLANTKDESCGSVRDSLETIKLVLWSTGQPTVTVVDP